MPAAATVLPDQDEFTRRLQALDGEPHKVKEFYPKLVRKAGTRVTGAGFVMALHLAVSELPPVIAGTLLRELDAYVRVIIDDPVVQRDALKALADLTKS
ncbi:hypothetical protein OG413_41105 [Streptomyces sp. NBC_01433]|uniref:hypothetical protein n=1 Tax=Streptomyces sp. NBC_01433 TaxID=2903864 RepID=UPI002259626D|nr:hypothetical protein [Streptomyces sp. NBC_01433]MCX4681603.1 hypothetical protein [Streptomyces sp. NBC_01433]